MTLQEVAEILDVHYMTVYRYVREGMLPAVRVDRGWQVDKAVLKEFQLAKKSSGKGESKARHGGRDSADWVDRIVGRLIDGDEVGSANILNSALRSGHDLQFIYVDILIPALVIIGDQWESGKIDIYVEHRSSEIVFRLIVQLSLKFKRRGLDRGTVVVGAPKGELHSLTIAMITHLLRYEGWNVSNLGADLPADEFGKAVKNLQNVVGVCVVATMSSSLFEAAKSISAVRKVSKSNGDKSDKPTVKCFVGGSAIRSDDHAQELGADKWVKGPRELIVALDSVLSRVS